MKTINRQQLAAKLANSAPQNQDKSEGYALVSVLDRTNFLSGHIGLSINAPSGHENKLMESFDKNKEIIL